MVTKHIFILNLRQINKFSIRQMKQITLVYLNKTQVLLLIKVFAFAAFTGR